MNVYFEDKKIYVKNEDNLVYSTHSFEAYDGYGSLHINLKLEGGYDANENIRPVSYYDEEVHDVTEIQYFIQESLEECLKANGYTILSQEDAEKFYFHLHYQWLQ